MPKTRARDAASDNAPPPPIDLARDSADAMYRAAVECCHQHDRVSRITGKSRLDEEVAAAVELCTLCDASLRVLADSYERNAAAVRPQRADDHWWHSANTLWLASREYVRRNSVCEAASRDRERKEHGPDRLGALHAEYELEASALLGLKQAAESYRKTRPEA